jgi:coenzyme F420 hydrogenase subunit beta
LSGGAITMRSVAPGYARPLQHETLEPATEALIAQSCPGAVVAPWRAAPNAHPYWGPWRRIATGYAADERLRHQASSGGALSALLIHALRSGMIDRVAHVAPDPDNPSGNIMTCSTTEEEIADRAGSRYVASSPLLDIDRLLADGGAFAFVGKPCDASALRQLARRDERVQRHVPLLLSFFCAGVPSSDGVNRMLSAMGVAREELVSLRYRGNGWPGNAAAKTRDGRTREMSYEESWGEHLCKEVQFRCKICPDAVGGVADISCGDAWYANARGYPSFDDRPGRSLIVTRTELGDRFLEEAAAAKVLYVDALDVDQIELMQPSQAERKRFVKARVAALTATLQPKPDMRGTMVDEAARTASLPQKARNLLGAARRVVIGRR